MTWGDWNSARTGFNQFRLQNTVSLLMAPLAEDTCPSHAAPQPTLLRCGTLPAAGASLMAIPGPPVQKGLTRLENPSPLHTLLLLPARRSHHPGAVGRGCPIPGEPCQGSPLLSSATVGGRETLPQPSTSPPISET